MTITRETEIHIDMTPEEMAHEFWLMGADEQAQFFSALADLTEGGLSMQLQFISNASELTDGGRAVMVKIGEYGQ